MMVTGRWIATSHLEAHSFPWNSPVWLAIQIQPSQHKFLRNSHVENRWTRAPCRGSASLGKADPYGSRDSLHHIAGGLTRGFRGFSEGFCGALVWDPAVPLKLALSVKIKPALNPKGLLGMKRALLSADGFSCVDGPVRWGCRHHGNHLPLSASGCFCTLPLHHS